MPPFRLDPDNHTRVLTRIYGLGGKDFDDADAESFFREALETADTGKVEEPFAYHGIYAGDQIKKCCPLACLPLRRQKFPGAWPPSARMPKAAS